MSELYGRQVNTAKLLCKSWKHDPFGILMNAPVVVSNPKSSDSAKPNTIELLIQHDTFPQFSCIFGYIHLKFIILLH